MAARPDHWHGGHMLASRASLLALLVVLGASLVSASAASAATQRHAGPTGGDGGACTSADPCSIRTAVEGAASGDEVIVAPGDYPLTATLSDAAPITIHGVAGRPRPRLLFSGAGQEGLVLTHSSTLRYVQVEQSGPEPALITFGGSVEQVIARGSDLPGEATAYISNGVIRNSVLVAPGTNGFALQTIAGAYDRSGTYRNVTAIATGTGGVAIWVGASTASANVLARNVIARGGPAGYDLVAHASYPEATAKLTVDHSNWLGDSAQGAGAASIVDGGGNQSAAPAFVNAAAGDYRQAPGSPTIDAGLDEIISGPFDVDGDPRQIDGIDIGADEYVAPPDVTTGPPSALSDRSATLSGSVDANGAPSGYRFEYGTTTAYGSATPAADAGSGLAVAAATLGGLTPATTYHYRLVASNSGGETGGADRTFTTAPAPAPPATSPTPPSTSSPAPAFAGVGLVSSRLSFRGRFVTLKLSCPAGTVGGCSGRTKLTARRSSVVLGRARFSIAAGERAKVRARVRPAGRRLLRGVRRLRAKDTNVARDGAGGSATTVAAVTIRRRPSR